MISILVAFGAAQATHQGFAGARQVLAEVHRPTNESALGDPRLAFAEASARFGRRLGSLSPADAASGWLQLAKACLSLQADQGTVYVGGQSFELLSALPEPDVWPIIERHATGGAFGQGNRAQALLVLLDVLLGKSSQALGRLDVLEKQLPEGFSFTAQAIRREIAMRQSSPDAIEAELRREADLTAEPADGMYHNQTLEVPDVAPLLGRERARRLLSYVLFKARAELIVFRSEVAEGGNDSQTANLARQVMQEHPEQVAWPQWTLACSLDARDLYDIFRRRFPHWQPLRMMSQMPPSSRDQAAPYRLAILYLSGDLSGAKAFETAHAEELRNPFGEAPEAIRTGLERRGKLAGFTAMLRELALADMDGPMAGIYWQYADRSETPARLEAFLKLAQQAEARANQRGGYHQLYFRDVGLRDLYLQQGRYDLVLSDIEKHGSSDSGESEFGPSPRLLVVLGRALHRPDLVNRGLAWAAADYGKAQTFIDNDLTADMIRAGMGPRLEKSIIEAMKVKPNGTGSPPIGQDDTLKLVGLYFDLRRYQDVVTLFERYPRWRAIDITDIRLECAGHPTPYVLAYSLAKLGRVADACRVLRFAAQSDLNDEEYALLIDLAPNDAWDLLDHAAATHPTSCRPLLWKANLLLRRHKLQEAEATAKRAISLDPLDLEGWQIPTRFEAYAVLAGIERAMGHAGAAQGLGRYAKAAELSKAAIDFDGWNLYQFAIDRYREELALLPEDFRARLQLGAELLAIGKDSEGREQIRTAYRSVPAKLGPASFYGMRFYSVQNAWAEFEHGLETEARHGTRNPGVYTLLGEMSDGQEAVGYFAKAAGIDPSNLQASTRLWWEILDARRPNANEAFAKLLATKNLDELRSHAPFFVPNYRACWLEAAAAGKDRIEAAKPVFELHASAAQLGHSADSDFVDERNSQLIDQERDLPGAILASDSLLGAVINLINEVRD